MKNDTNMKNEAPSGPEADQLEGELPESKPTKVSKPSQGFGKRIVRWILWLLIVFGLGATAVMVFLYIPLQQKHGAAEANLTASAQKLSDNEKKIESLTAQMADLENKNKDMQSQLEQANLRLATINAKSDILAASLAVSNGDPVSARLSLEKATVDMQTLASLLKDSSLSEVLATIQQHLELVKSKINSDVKSAQPDLNMLIDNLSKLQDTLKN
jgi:hypothetical protein